MSERPLTYDHLRSRKKPNLKSVRLALDSEVAEEFEQAKEELERLATRMEYMTEEDTRLPVLRAQRDEAQVRFDQAKEAVLEESVLFKFRSIGRKRFDDLIASHPPTEAQIEKAKKTGEGDLTWNSETFPPALVFNCLVEPKLEEHEVKDLWESDDWAGSEIIALFYAALEVNTNRRTLELGKG